MASPCTFEDGFSHLPELYLTLGALKKRLSIAQTLHLFASRSFDSWQQNRTLLFVPFIRTKCFLVTLFEYIFHLIAFHSIRLDRHGVCCFDASSRWRCHPQQWLHRRHCGYDGPRCFNSMVKDVYPDFCEPQYGLG